MNALLPQLEALVEAGAHRFDPARFRFIESLLGRIDHHQGSSKQQLEQRVQDALNQIREDFEKAKTDAKLLLNQAVGTDPDSTLRLEQCWQSGDLNTLQRLIRRLQREQRTHTPNRQQLSALTQTMLANNADLDNSPQASLDIQLRRQEAMASQSLQTTRQRAPIAGELKSLRDFRDSWSQFHSQTLVDQSVDQGPKDAGPLNPERLAIRSLSVLQRLSGHYLNRFVSYVETLLWLQQIEQRGNTASRKKSAS